MSPLPPSPALSDSPRPATFEVDAVVAARRPLWRESLADSVARRFSRELLLLPDADRLVINSVMDSLSDNLRARFPEGFAQRGYPLIDAVQTAFAQHYPLTLSPDSIWLVLAQGFSHHLAVQAETLRPRLVRHAGRRTLMELVVDLSQASVEQALAGFSSQIRAATDPVLHDTLVCDFTTTTPAIRTASEVVLLDSYSSYFEYQMGCICGIPRITLTGSIGDWQRLRARVEVLATYELDWWVARLRPILDELVRTAEGKPDRHFWQSIYKPERAYGDVTVTGWIADLFPYLGEAPERQRNAVFEHRRQDWAIPIEKGVPTARRLQLPGVEHKGVASRSFPSGLASVPVRVSFPDGSRRELDLVGGYLAVEQAADDLSLSPLISWALTARPPATPVLL